METTRKPQTLPQRPVASNLPPLRPHFMPSAANLSKAANNPPMTKNNAPTSSRTIDDGSTFRVDQAHTARVPAAHITFSNSFDVNEYEGWTVQDISFAVSPNQAFFDAEGSPNHRPKIANFANTKSLNERSVKVTNTPVNPSLGNNTNLTSSLATKNSLTNQQTRYSASVRPTPVVAVGDDTINGTDNVIAALTKTLDNVRTPIESAAESWSAKSRSQIVGFDWHDSRRDDAEQTTLHLTSSEMLGSVERVKNLGPMSPPFSAEETIPPTLSFSIRDSAEQTKGVEFEIASPMWPEMTDRLLLTALPYIRQIGSALLKPKIENSSWLLTAPERGVGTTTMGLAIARWLSAQNQRVLLVDADFNRAGLSRSLHIDGSFSWLSTLRGDRPLRETTVRFSGSSLSLLPLAAIRTRNLWPTDLLDLLAGKLAELRREYDQVLIDVGPMSQWVSETQDIKNVGQQCFLVVRHAGTNQQQLEQTQLRLNGLGIQQLLVANITPTLRAAS